MTRRLLPLLAVLFVLTGAAACSSSSKEDEGAAPTTEAEEKKQDEEEEDTTGTTEAAEDEDSSPTTARTRARIDLGSLRGGSSSEGDSPFTAADEECVAEGLADDPFLSGYDSYDEISDPSDREAFWNIVIDCVGPDPLIQLFMDGFREGAPDLTTAQYACVEDEVAALSRDEAVALLSEDPTVTEDLTTSIVLNCSIS